MSEYVPQPGKLTPGRRVDADPGEKDQYQFPRLQPGDYGRDADGVWYCRPPWQHASGCLGNGTDHHKVVEHEDGTITVSPSILVIQPPIGQWHGFLERGVWREV